MPQTLDNIQPRPDERPHGYDESSLRGAASGYDVYNAGGDLREPGINGDEVDLQLSLTDDITTQERSDAASRLTAQGIDLYDDDLDAIRKLTPVNDVEVAGGGRESRIYVTITTPVGLWTNALYLP
ncbi:MAG: hypothetical protein LBB86_03310, partial [Oscillospiraceae bacterium]|nr:hypothetical protein [Oscillospiraceae bacterium]